MKKNQSSWKKALKFALVFALGFGAEYVWVKYTPEPVCPAVAISFQTQRELQQLREAKRTMKGDIDMLWYLCCQWDTAISYYDALGVKAP